MTVKQFFKSTAFKCITALLCILLVCGVFLTVAYSFLEVTEGERLQRAVSKLYGGEQVTVYGLDDKEITPDDKAPQSYVTETVSIGRADITAAYRVEFENDEGHQVHYLISSRGKDGNDGGTVTCWVAIEVENNAILQIYKISITANTAQEYADGRFNDAYFAKFTGKDNYEDGKEFSTAAGYFVSGATQSSNAINNSINGALNFVKATFLGEEITETQYTVYINLEQTEFNKDSRKFTVVTKAGGETGLKPNPFTVEIVISTDKKIESFTIVTNGSTSDRWADRMNESIKNGTLFVGKDLAAIETMIAYGEINDLTEGEIKAGATHSNFLCGYACAFALANFDSYMGGNI